MIDIFDIQATDQEDDNLEAEIDSFLSTQDSPNNIGQVSVGISVSNQFFQENLKENSGDYQKEMDQIEQQIQKEIEENDFTNLTKKERYKIIRKIKNKYSSRKSRLKKMLVKDNLENINQDLKKQVASLRVQVQNLNKQNQFLLENIFNLNQMIENNNFDTAKEVVKKYRVEKQNNQFILSKNFLFVVALFLIVMSHAGPDQQSTSSTKIGGFDHKYFANINQGFQLSNNTIQEKPIIFRKFQKVNRKIFMKQFENLRKRAKISTQFNCLILIEK